MERAFKKDALREIFISLLKDVSNESSILNNFTKKTCDLLLLKEKGSESEDLIESLNSILLINKNNLSKIETLFGEIVEIIDSIYFEAELILNDKFDYYVKNYLDKLFFVKNKIIDFYEFKSNSKNIIEENIIPEITSLSSEVNLFIVEFKKSFNLLNRGLREIKNSLKKSFSQNQIIINEQFKVFLNKELENANKILNNEKLAITTGLKHEVRSILNIVESQKNKIIGDLSSEKDNIENLISVANSEIQTLKVGFEAIKDDNFNLTKEISNYSNSINNLVGLKTQELNEKLQGHVESLKSDLNLKIKEINDSYENAKKNYQNFSALAERAGIYGLTQNYAKKAKEEKLEYQNYRKYTTFSILAAIGTTIAIILIPIIEHWGSQLNMDSNYYYTLMARLTISVMFFVLALYLSKQSSKHYECYQENHRTYLQLAALEPFINRMSDEEQLNIRKSLIPIYFNQNKDGKYSSKDDEVKLPNFTSHLKKLKPMSKMSINNTK